MDDAGKLGRQFEFENAFWAKPVKCNFVNLYQVGELGCECDFKIDDHLQICHEVTYIISGDGYVTTDSKELKATAGDIFLTRKGQMHAIRADKQSEMRYYYLAFDFNEDTEKPPFNAAKELFSADNGIKMHDSMEIDKPFSKLISEMYYLYDYSDEMVNTYIEQILLLICRLFSNRVQSSDYIPSKSAKPVGYTVYAVVRYISENIFNIDSIGKMARELGYCDSYLSRVFKEKMGMTLQSYVTMKKMEKAVEMIEQGNFTITEIALKLSFESLQSFSKSLRRTVGVSPMEYRKEYFSKKKSE